MPHEHVRQRALPRAVGPHDRVNLTYADLKIQPLHDLVAVDLNPQIFYL
jgi:hypothetical protein